MEIREGNQNESKKDFLYEVGGDLVKICDKLDKELGINNSEELVKKFTELRQADLWVESVAKNEDQKKSLYETGAKLVSICDKLDRELGINNSEELVKKFTELRQADLWVESVEQEKA